MPRYHALDTAVKLSVWDPNTKPKIKDQDYSTPPSSISDAFLRLNGAFLLKSKRKDEEKAGPAIGYVVDDLEEDYFEGHEGLEFLAPGMPFYLVKAGRELFAAKKEPAYHPSPGSKGAILTTTPSTALADVPNSSSQLSDPNTNLFTVEAEFFTPGQGSFAAPKEAAREGEDTQYATETLVNNAVSTLVFSRLRNELRTQAVDKPITSSKPITLTVDLSRKSFMPSLVTNQRQELCITVYYNGELTQSRILRPNTFGGVGGPVNDEKFQYYSGRRIDSFMEIPWIVRPHSAIRGSSSGLSQTGEVEALGFEERWNKINQILLVEADEWGYYGRFRSPMGEYLEGLSKTGVPKGVTNGGDGVGIIDVVITLGRTVTAAVAGLREPRRKLHEDHCGKLGQLIVAPEELRPKKKAKIVAHFKLENPLSSQPVRNGNTFTIEERRTCGKRPAYRATQFSVADKNSPIQATPTNKNQDGASESFPAFEGGDEEATDPVRNAWMAPPSLSRRASLPIPSSSPFAHHIGPSQSFHVPTTPVQEHLNKPKNIPQKRYKGVVSDSDSGRPVMRRRIDMELHTISFDPDKPTSASTRSRRAVSSPIVPSPDSIRIQQSMMDGQKSRRLIPVGGTSSFLPKSRNENEADSVEERPTTHYISVDRSLLKAVSPVGSPASLRGSNLRTSRLAWDNDHSPVEIPNTICVIPTNQKSEQSVQEAADIIPTASSALSGNQVPFNEVEPLEKDEHVQQSSSLSEVSRGQRHSTHCEFDGTSDTPRRPSRPRSSMASTRSRSFLPQSENESVFETSATSAGLSSQQSDPTEEIAPKKSVRIVFTIKNKEVSSAVVNREKFTALQLPDFAVEKEQPSPVTEDDAAGAIILSLWKQTNKFVTENHPSVRKRRAAEAAAAGASDEVVANLLAKATKTSAQKRQRKPAFSGPLAKIGEETSMADTPAIAMEESVGGLAPLVQQSEATTGMGSTGGKPLFSRKLIDVTHPLGSKTIFFPPAPPYKKVRPSTPGGSSRKASNATSEGSNSIETAPKTQSKLKRNSISSRTPSNPKPENSERVQNLPKTQTNAKGNSVLFTQPYIRPSEEEAMIGAHEMIQAEDMTEQYLKAQTKLTKASFSSTKRVNTMLDGSQKTDRPPKAQLTRQREVVSSRELKELLEPHTSATGIDTSFGASFREAPKRARSSRNLNPAYALPQLSHPGPSGMEAGPSRPSFMVDSEKAAVPMIRRKFGGSAIEPMFPNLLPTASPAAELQIDEAAAGFFARAFQLEDATNAGSSKRKLSQVSAKTPLETPSLPIVSIIPSTTASVNENLSVVKPTDVATFAIPAPKPSDFTDLETPHARQSRGYSVDSEGKKVPTPRKDSLSGSTKNPTPETEGKYSNLSLDQAATSSSVPARRSSLSQVKPETPKLPTTLRRKLPEAPPSQNNVSAPAKNSSLSQSMHETPRMSTAPRRKLLDTAPQRNGGSSTVASTTRISAPLQTPKISSSENITFSTPSPPATLSVPIRTPASQSRARRKRKASEISSPGTDDRDSRSWKPTSMCDGSVVGYASGKAFPGTSIDTVSKSVCRTIKAEREGVFRASGVLMGVRFVVGLV